MFLCLVLLCELQAVDFIGKSESHSTDLQGQDRRILLCVRVCTNTILFLPLLRFWPDDLMPFTLPLCLI